MILPLTGGARGGFKRYIIVTITTTALCQQLGHQFNNPSLLEDALSHRSFRGKNNERLEFLGDAILNYVIAAALFRHYPEAREGELSRIRASLVREETLAALAQEFNLGYSLKLGAGELKSGGSARTSILADAVEAIIGAIYLDAGMATCEQCVLQWYASRLTNLDEVPNLKDAKTRLQEYLQAHKHALPLYEIQTIEGAAHKQIFSVNCRIEGLPHAAIGTGTSRRRAEQEAAQKVLDLFTHE